MPQTYGNAVARLGTHNCRRMNGCCSLCGIVSLASRTPEEFSSQLQRALSSEPHPLTPQQLHSLTWEAATERFLDIAELRPGTIGERTAQSGPCMLVVRLFNCLSEANMG